MDLAITFKGEMDFPHMLSLARSAERAGFSHAWVFDSHVLWKECYTILTFLGLGTERLRVGPLVTHPAARDVTVTASIACTLGLLTGHRVDLGLGRGDSSRRYRGIAVRAPRTRPTSSPRPSLASPR